MQLARINTTTSPLTPMPRRRGRPSGVVRCRQRARHVIADGIVSGKPVAAIARELGVSRSWASREAHAPETRKLVDALAEQYREVFHALFETGLNAIVRGLAAHKFVTGNGKRVDLGPDHRVRLMAAGLLLDLLRAMSACLTEDRSKATVGAYRFLPKLISIAQKVAALAR